MKLLHFADLHLDTQFELVGGRVARKRRLALRETLRRILEVAAEVGADAVLCGGDLFEQERFSPDTTEFLRGMFAGVYPMRIFVAPGNRDWYGPRSPYRIIRWSPNVHIFDSDRLEPVTIEEGVTLWGAAHRGPAKADGFLTDFRVDRDGTNLALFHGSERTSFLLQGDSTAPHAPFDAVQLEAAGIDHAFLGHHHVPEDADRHTYPGNPDPLTFGEAGIRGVVIATLEPNGAVRRERRVVAQSRVHDVAVDVMGCTSNQEIRDRIVGTLAGLAGTARVTLEGELASDLELALGPPEELGPLLDAIILRLGRARSQYDFELLAQQSTVRGQFVREVRSSTLDPDQQFRVLVTGLRALAGRSDLEVN